MRIYAGRLVGRVIRPSSGRITGKPEMKGLLPGCRRQVNSYLPSRPITGQCWMNIRLVRAEMVSALEVHFDFSDRKPRHQALIP
jgi:hypothetical protein